MSEGNLLSQAGAPLRRLLTTLERFPLWPLQTMGRISIGWVFYRSAANKIASWDITLLLFRDEYQVPLLPYDVAAMLATVVEMTGGLLLFAGLFSRLATLPLLGVIAVIQTFVYPDAWGEHLTWTTLLLLVLLRGPGPISLDHLVSRITGFGSVRMAGT